MEGLEGERAVLRSAAAAQSSRGKSGQRVRVSPNGKGHAGQASQDLGTSVMQQLSPQCLVLGACCLVQSVHAPGQGGGWQGAGGGGDDTRARSTARNVSRLTPHGEARGTSHDTLAIRI